MCILLMHCRPSRVNEAFIQRCALGVTAYVVLRPIMTLVALLAYPFGG